MCQRNCSGVAPGTSFTRLSVYVPVKRFASPAVVMAVTTTGTVAWIDPAAPSVSTSPVISTPECAVCAKPAANCL